MYGFYPSLQDYVLEEDSRCQGNSIGYSNAFYREFAKNHTKDKAESAQNQRRVP